MTQNNALSASSRFDPQKSETVPFLKWAGGKRWLAPTVANLLTGSLRYFEPFAGSGACFFATSFLNAYLSDNNAELMNCYRVVRDRPNQLIQKLELLDVSKPTFIRLRSTKVRSQLDRAVRFIYLNRTAFNGLYRVNLKGDFNVPFGCKPTTTSCNASAILACSNKLSHAQLTDCDFRTALARIRLSDGIYVDPPYTVMHNDNAFRRYNERLFSWSDQISLASIVTKLAMKGVRVVVTNACHADLFSLYSRKAFHAFSVVRLSNMAASACKRGSRTELLLVSRTSGLSGRLLAEILNFHLPERFTRIQLPHC